MDIIDTYRTLIAPVAKITHDAVRGALTEPDAQAMMDDVINNRTSKERNDLEDVRAEIRLNVYRALKGGVL